MGVKYSATWKNFKDQSCKVELDVSGYTGDIIELRAVQNNAVVLTYDSQDPFEAIVNSKADISLYNQGNIDVSELQLAGDKDIRVNVYVDDLATIFWTGYMIPDGIKNPFKSAPYQLNLTATDGLMLLSDLDFNIVKGDYVVSEIIDTVFSELNLGIPLPTVWYNPMKGYYDGIAIKDRPVNKKLYNGRKCLWLLEGVLKAISSRIYQKDGEWIIEQLEYNSHKTTKEIGINGHRLINDDAYLTVRPALLGVDVNYNYSKNENVITNGGFDEVNPDTNLPYNWIITDPVDPNTHSEYFGYKNRDDIGLQVKMDTVFSEKANIDAFTCFKGFQMHFDFMPVSGFPTDEDGFLSNLTDPLFSLIFTYTCKGGRFYNNVTNQYEYLPERVYYLTEFGYFKLSSGTESSVKFTIPDLLQNRKIKLGDVIQVSFDKFGDIKLPNPGNIDRGDTWPNPATESYFSVIIFESSLANTVSMYGNFEVIVSNTKDVHQVRKVDSSYTEVEQVELDISTSFNSFYDSDIKGLEKNTNSDYKFLIDGQNLNLSESVGYQMLKMRHLPSIFFEGSFMLKDGVSWEYGEMYTIDAIEGSKFLPLQMQYNIETCTVSATLFEFRNDLVNVDIKHLGGDDLSEGEPIVIYGNVEIKNSFYSYWVDHNCPESNPYIEYLVPANKWTSTKSQAEADSFAQFDLEQNGQAQANNMTSCPV